LQFKIFLGARDAVRVRTARSVDPREIAGKRRRAVK